MATVAVLLALAAAGCGTAGRAAQEGPFSGAIWPAKARAPGFALRDQHGQLVRLGAQRGRFVIVAFLYTRCRDVCPLIASQLGTALRELGPARRDVRVLAVSVDPRGDTPASVRRFVRARRLPRQFRYLTGTRRQLAPVWHAYHVAVQPHNLDSVDHSAYELLIDRSGRPRLTYDSNVQAGDVVHDLRRLGLA